MTGSLFPHDDCCAANGKVYRIGGNTTVTVNILKQNAFSGLQKILLRHVFSNRGPIIYSSEEFFCLKVNTRAYQNKLFDVNVCKTFIFISDFDVSPSDTIIAELFLPLLAQNNHRLTKRTS